MIKHLELFAGIGGFRRAMDLLTADNIMYFKCVGWSEIDKDATKTYKTNYNINDEVEIGDIVKFTGDKERMESVDDFDLLTGGFPCQTFSTLGSQKGFDDMDRGQMFFRIIDILEMKRPKYVLLENVKNLIHHDGGNTFKTIKAELENLGYNVYCDVFNTKDFHIPQSRQRVLIFCTTEKMDEGFEFSSEKVIEMFDRDYMSLGTCHYNDVTDVLAQEVDKKYYLSEKFKPTILSNGTKGFQANSEINQIIARCLTATMHKMHRAYQDNYYSDDFITSHGKIDLSLGKSKEEIAKLAIRKLTPEECFMLQGFPKEFATNARNSGVSNTSLYKQAGNAVTVNTIYAVLYYLIKVGAIKE